MVRNSTKSKPSSKSQGPLGSPGDLGLGVLIQGTAFGDGLICIFKTIEEIEESLQYLENTLSPFLIPSVKKPADNTDAGGHLLTCEIPALKELDRVYQKLQTILWRVKDLTDSNCGCRTDLKCKS